MPWLPGTFHFNARERWRHRRVNGEYVRQQLRGLVTWCWA
jgi:hypothetical protein